MDMKLRKGMAAALAVCVLGSTVGCNREEPIDTSAIETIPARFIDALATDNASAMISITRDYDYAEDTEGIRLGMGDYYDLFEHFVSLTEITEFGEIVLDDARSLDIEELVVLEGIVLRLIEVDLPLYELEGVILQDDGESPQGQGRRA